jgi:Arc/MetJ family transcription regulator
MTRAEAKAYRKMRRREIGVSMYDTMTSAHTHIGVEDEFNARTIRQYAHTLLSLAREYHELMKLDFPITHDDFGNRIKRRK